MAATAEAINTCDPAALLAYLSSEGTVYGALPKALCLLLDISEQSQRRDTIEALPPVAAGCGLGPGPARQEGRSERQSFAAYYLLTCVLTSLTCPLRAANQAGDPGVSGVLEALIGTGLPAVLVAATSQLLPHASPNPETPPVASSASDPGWGMHAADCAARAGAAFLNLLSQHEIAGGRLGQDAAISQMALCTSTVGARVLSSLDVGHSPNSFANWSHAVSCVADTVFRSLREHAQATDGLLVPTSAPACVAWKWALSQPALASFLLSFTGLSAVVGSSYHQKVRAILCRWLEGHCQQSGSAAASGHLLAALHPQERDLTAMAQLVLRRMGSGTHDACLSEAGYLLMRLFKFTPYKAGLWAMTADVVRHALVTEPLGVSAGPQSPSGNRSMGGLMATYATSLLNDMVHLRQDPASHVWVLQEGILARSELWLRSPLLLGTPSALASATSAAASVASTLALRLLRLGGRRAVLAEQVASLLSVVATARKVAVAHATAGGPGGTWLVDLLSELLTHVHAPSPAETATLRCVSLQLLGAGLQQMPVPCPVEGAQRLAELLLAMHHLGMEDVSAAAGAPAHLLTVFTHTLDCGLPQPLSLGSRGDSASTSAALPPVVSASLGPATVHVAAVEHALHVAELTLQVVSAAGTEEGWSLVAPQLALAAQRAVDMAAADGFAIPVLVPSASRKGGGRGAGASARLPPAGRGTLQSLEAVRIRVQQALSLADEAVCAAEAGSEAGLSCDTLQRLPSTWDSCLMATCPITSGSTAARTRTFFGCWNHGCVNLGSATEASLHLLNCELCRRARYCSKDCQQVAWTAGHRAACMAWRQQREQQHTVLGEPMDA